MIRVSKGAFYQTTIYLKKYSRYQFYAQTSKVVYKRSIFSCLYDILKAIPAKNGTVILAGSDVKRMEV